MVWCMADSRVYVVGRKLLFKAVQSLHVDSIGNVSWSELM